MIRHHLFIFLFLLQFAFVSQAQKSFEFEPSQEHPFGLPNPAMPTEMMDYAPLIGECDCKSVSRINQNTWGDTIPMTWRFKYIMNGMAIQDETLKEDGGHSGSIRQFIADSSRWYVHYYSSAKPAPSFGTWEGNTNEEGNIILYKEQKAPNGADGYYKITFSEISAAGFNWLGQWTSIDESISYPTWKIFCKKRKENNDLEQKLILLENIQQFSNDYVQANYVGLANAYTEDAKIFPGNSDIINGRQAIQEKWTIKNGATILSHRISPQEIQFIGNYAYDYGYYEGESKSSSGETSSFKGKYVIVWKKIGQDWKIYLDIWNRI